MLIFYVCVKEKSMHEFKNLKSSSTWSNGCGEWYITYKLKDPCNLTIWSGNNPHFSVKLQKIKRTNSQHQKRAIGIHEIQISMSSFFSAILYRSCQVVKDPSRFSLLYFKWQNICFFDIIRICLSFEINREVKIITVQNSWHA